MRQAPEKPKALTAIIDFSRLAGDSHVVWIIVNGNTVVRRSIRATGRAVDDAYAILTDPEFSKYDIANTVIDVNGGELAEAMKGPHGYSKPVFVLRR